MSEDDPAQVRRGDSMATDEGEWLDFRTAAPQLAETGERLWDVKATHAKGVFLTIFNSVCLPSIQPTLVATPAN